MGGNANAITIKVSLAKQRSHKSVHKLYFFFYNLSLELQKTIEHCRGIGFIGQLTQQLAE